MLALSTGFVLHFTRFGRYVFAIGGNEQAAIADRRSGAPDQGRGLHDLGAVGRHRGVIEAGWLGAVTTNLGNGMELR